MNDWKTNIHYLESTQSTQDKLRENLAKDIAIQGFYTFRQHEGYGNGGNSWYTGNGNNIALSIAFSFENFPSSRQFDVSKVISLAVTRYLLTKHVSAKIKWPNDILVNDKKICGILIEHKIIGTYISKTLVGIGININETLFPPDLPNAISLAQITGQPYRLEEEITLLCEQLIECIQFLKDSTLDIDNEYLNIFYAKDEWRHFSCKNNIFVGRIHGINEFGQLLIEKSEGEIEAYGFKEIEWVLSNK